MLPRIFINSSLNLSQNIVLNDVAYGHIIRVLRLKIGEQVVLFNGRGGEFLGKLVTVTKDKAIVLLEEYCPHHAESPLKIHLGQSIAKGEKMDFIIQKAIELGVTTITPLFTERCNVKLDPSRLAKKLKHWQGVMISALEQSGRCHLPQILPPQNLDVWYHSLQISQRLVFTPLATIKLNTLKSQNPNTTTILVGPEGGLSDQEIELAKQNNFCPISLGPRILRTETAALTAVSILQAMWGDI